MRYKHLDNANVDISALTVGTWAIGGQNYGTVNDGDSIAAIRTMIDNGVNVVDTAPTYGPGTSEMVVGKALADGYRDKVFLSTKFGCGVTDKGELWRNGGHDNCIKQCEESLKRLNTDHIDFYFIHWPDYNTPISETMKALEELKKAGKIRFIGVSNFCKDMIQECQNYGRIDVIQPPYSMVNEDERPLMKWCETQGIGAFTYGSLGSGILTGTIRTMPKWDPNDMRVIFYDFYREPKFSKCMELLKVLDKVAEAHNKPVAQVAINWSTQKSYVSTALCGVRNSKEAEENCHAFDWSLSDEEIKTIDMKLRELDI